MSAVWIEIPVPLETGKQVEVSSFASYIPCKKMHLTLMYLGEAENGTDVWEKACRIASNVAYVCRYDLNVNTQGVGYFGASVLYASVKESVELRSLRRSCELFAAQQGIYDMLSYIPHITLAKLHNVRQYGVPEIPNVAFNAPYIVAKAKNQSKWFRLGDYTKP